jgi:DNA-binding response OmpR family regulator
MPRILVVDDSPDLALIMRMQLERAGHEVITAENGRRGLRRFFEDRPDLVILDLRMPDLDGWATLERLRDLSDVPVLINSGQTPTAAEFQRLRPELDGFVSKPAHGPDIVRRVEALLAAATAARSVGDVRAQLVQPDGRGRVARRAPVAAR